MKRDPLSICREYLRSSSPETRRKVVPVLAVSSGAVELARLALTDQDEAVRRRAEQAIARLDPEARAAALTEIDEALAKNAQGSRDRRLAAHALLTRLRNQGIPLPRSHRAPLERLRLAMTARRAVAHQEPVAWSRAYPWCLAFAFLGALMVSFLVALKTTTASFGLPLVIITVVLLISLLLARTAITGAQPGDRYLDRVPGWIAEILGSGLAALPVFSVSIVILLLIWPPLVETSGSTVMLIGFGLLAWGWFFIAAIRAATLSSAILFSRSWGSTLFGAAAGWGAGITAANILLFLAIRSTAEEAEEIVTLATVFWLLALPIAAGVAATFARLERGARPPARWRFKILLTIPSLLGGLLLLSSWFWLFGSYTAQPSSCQALLPEIPASCVGIFDRLPARLRFQVDFGQKISIAKPDTADLIVRLWQNDQQIFSEGDRALPLIETELANGGYLLEIMDASEATTVSTWPRTPSRGTLADPLFAVAKRLAEVATDDSYDLRARRVEPFELELILNSKPLTAPSAAPAEIFSSNAEGRPERPMP